jgi:hypothetical protein
VLSKARRRWGTAVFEELFVRTVRQCVGAGLVDGAKLHMDGSLIDADASLGHPVSVHAMNLAVDKCRNTAVAVVSVFNSHHFGAAGCYSRIAADRGVIGMVTASTRGVTLVPTFAAEPVMGTNPLAFAAPARRNAVRADMPPDGGGGEGEGLAQPPVPSGWVVDGDGRPVTDAERAFGFVFDRPDGGISPLGGTRDLGSHKGYGLAVLVHILAGTLSGASFSPLRNRTQRPSDPHDIGHFFLAIDPRPARAVRKISTGHRRHGARRADPPAVLVAAIQASHAAASPTRVSPTPDNAAPRGIRPRECPFSRRHEPTMIKLVFCVMRLPRCATRGSSATGASMRPWSRPASGCGGMSGPSPARAVLRRGRGAGSTTAWPSSGFDSLESPAAAGTTRKGAPPASACSGQRRFVNCPLARLGGGGASSSEAPRTWALPPGRWTWSD